MRMRPSFRQAERQTGAGRPEGRSEHAPRRISFPTLNLHAVGVLASEPFDFQQLGCCNILTLDQLKSFQLRLLMLRHTLAHNPNYLCHTTPAEGKQPMAKLQKKIARLHFEENQHNWMNNESLMEKSIVQSNKAHMASRWTKIIPSVPQLTLSNDAITLCIAHCLCTSAVPATLSSRRGCCCGHALDPHDIHLLSCKRGGLQIRRHDAVVNLLYILAKQAGVTVQKEAVHVHQMFHDCATPLQTND
ncbi:hypothetical protein Pelo_17808 [Pelomyxa schiedti]|nr:hypothetical protein Pelo_17808 [Pelomyxa schiedti]